MLAPSTPIWPDLFIFRQVLHLPSTGVHLIHFPLLTFISVVIILGRRGVGGVGDGGRDKGCGETRVTGCEEREGEGEEVAGVEGEGGRDEVGLTLKNVCICL